MKGGDSAFGCRHVIEDTNDAPLNQFAVAAKIGVKELFGNRGGDRGRVQAFRDGVSLSSLPDAGTFQGAGFHEDRILPFCPRGRGDRDLDPELGALGCRGSDPGLFPGALCCP